MSDATVVDMIQLLLKKKREMLRRKQQEIASKASGANWVPIFGFVLPLGC